MNPIKSPLQDDDLMLTPAQKEARQKEKVEAFVEGIKKLENEIGITFKPVLQYSPEGIKVGLSFYPIKK